MTLKLPLTLDMTKAALAEYPGPGIAIRDADGHVVLLVMPLPDGTYDHAGQILDTLNHANEPQLAPPAEPPVHSHEHERHTHYHLAAAHEVYIQGDVVHIRPWIPPPTKAEVLADVTAKLEEEGIALFTPHTFQPFEKDALICARCGKGEDFKMHHRDTPGAA